ncbi:MAG: ABC transporter permease [Candidatus Promineifilaceae bacterium]|nr:ABC transporter permease [Candidatus Promineifilaceae bacterium]
MRAIWLVIKHEFAITVRKRSFWIMSLIVPGMLMALTVVNTFDAGDGDSTRGAGDPAEPPALPTVALVDLAGIVNELPEGLPPGMFVPYDDEAAARQALISDKVEQMVVLPADFLDSGEIKVYDRDFRLLSQEAGVAFDSPQAWTLRYLVNFSLIDDPQLAVAMFNPTPGDQAIMHPLNPPDENAVQAEQAAAVMGQVLPYVFYFVLVVGSGYLLQSVTAEKENRTAEVLLTSLRPRELMTGKLLGLGGVAFLQLFIWFGSWFILSDQGLFGVSPDAMRLETSLYVWMALYLVFGYLLYGSVMAAGGAIAPSAREGGQLTWLLIVPLMPTLMFSPEFANAPNGVLATVLSFIPFSAPSAMITRMAITDVPLWQPIVSLLGLAVTAYLFTSLAARFFRAGNLISQSAFSWKRMATGWRD